MKINIKYTLENTRVSGAAYIEDGNKRVLASASVIYIDHPEITDYVTTDRGLVASHFHKIIDYYAILENLFFTLIYI